MICCTSVHLVLFFCCVWISDMDLSAGCGDPKSLHERSRAPGWWHSIWLQHDLTISLSILLLVDRIRCIPAKMNAEPDTEKTNCLR